MAHYKCANSILTQIFLQLFPKLVLHLLHFLLIQTSRNQACLSINQRQVLHLRIQTKFLLFKQGFLRLHRQITMLQGLSTRLSKARLLSCTFLSILVSAHARRTSKTTCKNDLSSMIKTCLLNQLSQFQNQSQNQNLFLHLGALFLHETLFLLYFMQLFQLKPCP